MFYKTKPKFFFLRDYYLEVIETEFSDAHYTNKYTAEINNFIIPLIHIRSLNANIETLKIYVERVKVKPSIIVCIET